MRWVGEVFGGLGVTGWDREPSFPAGAALRVEIPGPRVGLPVRRSTVRVVRRGS